MKRCPECRRDYYDDSLLYCLDDGAALLEGPSSGEAQTTVLPTASTAADDETTKIYDESSRVPKRKLIGLGAIVGVIALAIGLSSFFLRAKRAGFGDAGASGIKTLAVLPLRSLDSDNNFLGLGIADAMIRRISQTGELTVRPLSAVRRYLSDETDALMAAKQLNVDAVLEGSVQKADDRLRVSVNLLRVADGASLWSDNFDMGAADIFKIQDEVAQQVASRLRLNLDRVQQQGLKSHSTSNPAAYEFYVKGIYNVDRLYAYGYSEKALPEVQTAADSFKKAIEADPSYALAHAQLASVYAHTALFIQPNETAWVTHAREEIDRAQSLDPQLAEIHVVRSQLLWSIHGGWQIEDAIREARMAQQLDPNVGHDILAVLYQHAGLERAAEREMQKNLEIDPTGEAVKALFVDMYGIVGKHDIAFDYAQRFYGRTDPVPLFYISRGRLDDAQRSIDQLELSDPGSAFLPGQRALLFAAKGDFDSAEKQIPTILERNHIKGPQYHHAVYIIANVYALEGKTGEAIKWLKETAATGFPCYPLFERDHSLDRIRQAPEFQQFMLEMKNQHDRLVTEFGD
jgi:TolB-like protein